MLVSHISTRIHSTQTTLMDGHAQDDEELVKGTLSLWVGERKRNGLGEK